MATLAIDVGGTKIAVGVVDADGELLHRAQEETPPGGDADSVWAVVERLVAEAKDAGDVTAVGIGAAGPINLRDGTVSPINIDGWNAFPIVDRVARLTGLPVRLGGDGLCMALGEQWRGAGQGAQFMLGMVVSTGIGGGLVLDGAPYDGRTGNAGHVGHVVVDVDGAKCTCGGHGCVETVASGPNIAKWARDHGWEAPPESNAKELAAAARTGDPTALRAYYRGATAIAAAIASVAAVCDLDLVVIGGGVSKAKGLLFLPLRETLTWYAGLDFIRELRVEPAALDGDAGLIGAAKLATLAT